MRWTTVLLFALLLAVQADLWFGKSSWPQVAGLSQRLQIQHAANAAARERNDRLAAEVTDLQEGLEMVEEKARAELGMLRPDEILVQLTPVPPAAARP